MRAADQPIAPWQRWQLVATIVGIGGALLLVLAGTVLALIERSTPPDQTTPAPAATGAVAADTRDRIAAQPMASVAPDAARSTAPSAELARSIDVPVATIDGPAGVHTGFPHTPEGAVGQLAAIEVRVIEAMSIPVAHEVHQAWAMPGGVNAAQWELTTSVQAFLSASGQEGNAKDETTMVAAVPAAAQVKGTDGPDWVLACVLLDVRASIVADARIGWGHCERMVWTGDRWLIGPGLPPAIAPSTWPGSQPAIDAGWLRWQETQR